ncbi:hypothetical protein RFI_28157, partial [Reticulomyxa filosa]
MEYFPGQVERQKKKNRYITYLRSKLVFFFVCVKKKKGIGIIQDKGEEDGESVYMADILDMNNLTIRQDHLTMENIQHVLLNKELWTYLLYLLHKLQHYQAKYLSLKEYVQHCSAHYISPQFPIPPVSAYNDNGNDNGNNNNNNNNNNTYLSSHLNQVIGTRIKLKNNPKATAATTATTATTTTTMTATTVATTPGLQNKQSNNTATSQSASIANRHGEIVHTPSGMRPPFFTSSWSITPHTPISLLTQDEQHNRNQRLYARQQSSPTALSQPQPTSSF